MTITVEQMRRAIEMFGPDDDFTVMPMPRPKVSQESAELTQAAPQVSAKPPSSRGSAKKQAVKAA